MIRRRVVRTLALLLVAVAVPAGAAPVPKAVKKKTDLQLLEGRWICVTFDGNGGQQPNTTFQMLVNGGTLAMKLGKPADESDAVPFTPDESASPKRFDVTWDGWKTPQRYIYTLDGDTLTLCHGSLESPRPTEFKIGDAQHVFIFQRVKELLPHPSSSTIATSACPASRRSSP